MSLKHTTADCSGPRTIRSAASWPASKIAGPYGATSSPSPASALAATSAPSRSAAAQEFAGPGSYRIVEWPRLRRYWMINRMPNNASTSTHR